MKLVSFSRALGTLTVTYAITCASVPVQAALVKNPDLWERIPSLVHDLIC